MKRELEMHEGVEAFERFRKAVRSVIAVSKNELPPRPHREKKKAAKRKA